MIALGKCIENIKTIVNSINEGAIQKHHKVLLDCSCLPIIKPGDESRCLDLVAEFFGSLTKRKQPVIYWFVVTSTHTFTQIKSKIKKADGIVKRKFPVSDGRRTYNVESKVLYVGKSTAGLESRMVSHLGYHKNHDNHGLQLCHWATELGLKLELNYIILPESLEDLTELFEGEISRQLKPIAGKKRKEIKRY